MPALSGISGADSLVQATTLTTKWSVQAGLKTGMYYLRTRAAADAIKFTVDQQALARSKAARISAPAADKVLKVTILDASFPALQFVKSMLLLVTYPVPYCVRRQSLPDNT